MTDPKIRLPVAAVLARKLVQRARWSVPSWRAVGVVAGERLAAAGAAGELIQTAEGEDYFLWGGLELELFRDGAETYWENLTGDNPALFIVCHETETGGLKPVTVTADPHEAFAGAETNKRVFSAQIPPEIYGIIERFVVEHHSPRPIRTRKRKNWTVESE